MLRWGGSLGLGEDIFGTPREEGQATDNDSPDLNCLVFSCFLYLSLSLSSFVPRQW